MKIPENMKEAKALCRTICRQHKVGIEFDDKWDNFNHAYNQCAYDGTRIECSRFSPWNYDLLVFSVMHELGHRQCDDSSAYHIFAREYFAWNYAITMYVNTFGQNISIKMARYMMECLNSYIPDYNDYIRGTEECFGERETAFFCPIKKRVIRRNKYKFGSS